MFFSFSRGLALLPLTPNTLLLFFAVVNSFFCIFLFFFQCYTSAVYCTFCPFFLGSLGGVGVYWCAVACKAFLAWLWLRLVYLFDLHRYGGFTGVLRRYTGIVLRLHACAVTYTRAGGGTGMRTGAQHAGVLPRTIPILCLGQTPVIRRGSGRRGNTRNRLDILRNIYREVYWAIC